MIPISDRMNFLENSLNTTNILSSPVKEKRHEVNNASSCILHNDSDKLLDRIEMIEIKLNNLKSHQENYNKNSVIDQNLNDELHRMKIHLKTLGDSTTLAIRHLTSGMTELQQGNSNFLDWSDKVYEYMTNLSQSTTKNDNIRINNFLPFPKLFFKTY